MKADDIRTLCVTGALGHWLLIRCYEVAEASAVQPFAYLQLVFASVISNNMLRRHINQAECPRMLFSIHMNSFAEIKIPANAHCRHSS